MNEPTFDVDGYPTEETLEQIEKWDVLPKGRFDFEAAMDFAGRAWSYPDYWEKDPAFAADEYTGQPPQLRYVFSTGGWSGNESIISSIEKNIMLQSFGAWSWRRGGHYEYRFPIEEKK